MPIFNCRVCGNEAYVKPSHQKSGSGKYCSRKCNTDSQKMGQLFACDVCGKQTYKSPQDQRRSKSKKFFCSKSCQTIWRNLTYVGEGHANWKGGLYSYRDALRRAGVSEICAKCENKDNRVLVAHHKDKNRKNNSVSNLIWLCHNCHHLVHHYQNESEGFMAAVA